ncbi:MAG TPA: MoxR family ATPase [Acidimicrobiales bacterium]|nr:MoxR family ATPase [Acidimicrobiales bacterium]
MIEPSELVGREAPGPGNRSDEVTEFAATFTAVTDRVCGVVKGKASQVRLALVCLLARGHLLLEDVPGVGKTSLAKAIAQSMGLTWTRVQFTPDLLPADITGTTVMGPDGQAFAFRRGPIFTNFLLADEINRASPKTQSALLEAMQEQQVTAGEHTYPLPSPFLVIATQNPVGHDGTFALPVSELDRFLVRSHLGYPDRSSALEMMQSASGASGAIDPVVGPEKVLHMIRTAADVFVAPALQEYMVDLVDATRSHHAVLLGLSPRALVGLQSASRAMAASQGRTYVVPDDVKALLGPVGNHRLVLQPEAAYQGTTAADVIDDVLTRTSPPVPSRRRVADG